MFNLGRIKTRLFIFLAVFGPATIAAIADNDAAGVATYSLAGAKFGYGVLFILLLITILLAITQEIGVRIGIVTGKGLGDLIRERYGIRVSLVIFMLLLIANVGTVVADFSALKAVSHLFSIPVVPLIVVVVAFAFLFISKGNYQTNQKIFLIGTILYFSYVVSAVKSHPHWNVAISNLVLPTGLKFSKEFIITCIAVLGTTITPWGQFFIQSFANDKKLSTDKLKYAQLETYFGAFLTNFFSFFMIVATAATLYLYHIQLHSGEEAALAIKPFAGDLASILFGIGLFNAAIMGIIIISLTTAYAFAEFFGVEGSLDAPFERGKTFYGLFLFQLIVAAIIVLIPSISLFKIVFFTQSLNAFLLPVLFFLLFKISNDKSLMGVYVNKKWNNYVILTGSVIIVIASLVAIIGSLVI